MLNSDEYNFCYDLGIAQKCTLEGKWDFIQIVAKHYGVFVVKAELDQILCGLSATLDMLEVIRSNASVMYPLFVYEEPEPLTAAFIQQLFPGVFSISGANRREAEEETFVHWTNYIDTIESKCQLTINIINYNYCNDNFPIQSQMVFWTLQMKMEIFPYSL